MNQHFYFFWILYSKTPMKGGHPVLIPTPLWGGKKRVLVWIVLNLFCLVIDSFCSRAMQDQMLWADVFYNFTRKLFCMSSMFVVLGVLVTQICTTISCSVMTRMGGNLGFTVFCRCALLAWTPVILPYLPNLWNSLENKMELQGQDCVIILTCYALTLGNIE